MKKNRFTSYLLYALGEILLVVVGILIAVLLNNSNNQSKLDRIEELSIVRLSEDLKDDINRYDFLDFRISERIHLCDSTLNLIKSQKSLDERLGIISIHQINFFLVESNTTTYDEMLNTGRLYSMKDKELRTQVIKYYRDVNKWSTYIERDNQQIRSKMIQPNYNDYWVLQEDIWDGQVINTQKYPWLLSTYSREIKDIEALIDQAEDGFRSSKKHIGYLKRQAEELLLKIAKDEL
ncbi:DUF6090 family protein [Ekhidna sp.]